ncbi:MAG: hypothetical protein ABL921_31085 [Pirellula sp.]
MTSDEFYRDKTVCLTEWWLDSCSLPEQHFARLRVFNDGTADSCFGPNDKLFGFDNRDYAGYILSEDEYMRVSYLDEDDATEYGIVLGDITPPVWPEDSHQDFEYLGTY